MKKNTFNKTISFLQIIIMTVVMLLNSGTTLTIVTKSKEIVDPSTLPLSVYGGTWNSGHLQGMTIDDERNYMYFSFTDRLVKTDMEGNVIGTVVGLTGHLGDLSFYNGKVYGSLEYKDKDSFYVAVFNGDAINEMNMSPSDKNVMSTMYLDEVCKDYVDPLDAGEYNNTASSMGHRYGCSGIDGITFGTVPGSNDDTMKMMVIYGIYANNNRDDNNYQVMLQYNIDDIENEGNHAVLDQVNYHQVGPKNEDKYFIYTGNTTYGVQNLEYDVDTGDYFMAVYNGTKPQYPNYPLYKIDGDVAPEIEALDFGSRTELYDNEEGKVLKLAEEGTKHESSGVWGFTSTGGNASTGFVSLGNDYFYISLSGANNGQYGYANMYQLDRNNNTFKKVENNSEPEKLLHYKMDANGIYTDSNGNTRIKDYSGNGKDAYISGTKSTIGEDGTINGALYFDAHDYPERVDRVYLDNDTVNWVNDNLGTNLTMSLWAYIEEPSDNFVPFAGIYKDGGRYAGVFEWRWLTKMKYVSNNGTPTSDGPGTDDGQYWGGYSSDISTGKGQWHHFAITQGNGSVTVYVDGVNGGTASIPSTALDNITNIEIGGATNKLWKDMNNRGRLTGAVDDFIVYKDMASEDFIKALYEAGPTSTDSKAAVTPESVNYDKADPKDLTFVVSQSNASSTLTGIGGLVKGVDYISSGNTVTLKKEYLSSLPNGTTTLNPEFSVIGPCNNIAINVIDTSNRFTPENPTFDKENPCDIEIKVNKGEATGIVGLTYGTDYTISDNNIVIKKEYLESNNVGTKMLFVKGVGLIEITITDSKSNSPSPLLYFNMDASSIENGIMKDMSSNNKKAIVEGTTSTIGSNGEADSALKFNGYDYVNIDRIKLDNETLNWLNDQVSTKLSYSFRMKATSENGNRMAVLGAYNEDGQPVGAFETKGTDGSNGTAKDNIFALYYDTTGNSSNTGSVPTGNLKTNEWIHVVGTYDATTGENLIYVNGKLKGISIESTKDVLDEIVSLNIGTNMKYNKYGAWQTVGGFVGDIDEVAIYNTILSSDYVNKIYNDGIEGDIEKPYEKIDNPLENIWNEIDKSKYTEESVRNLEDTIALLDSINYKTIQTEKDSISDKVNNAINGLIEKEKELEITDFSYNKDKINLGESVELKGDAQGNGLLKYRFVAVSGDHKEVIQDFTSNNRVTWTPKKSGKYNLYLVVKDNTGKIVQKVIRSYFVNGDPLTMTSFSISKDITKVGEGVYLTSSLIGTGKLKYRFVAVSGNYKEVIQDFDANGEAIWIPSRPGTYNIYAVGIDDYGKRVEKVIKKYIVKDRENILINNVSFNKNNEGVNIKVEAYGSDLQYKYFVLDGESNITVIKDYSSDNTALWLPKEDNIYIIWIHIKDSNGNMNFASMNY